MLPIALQVRKNGPLYIWIDILNVPIQSCRFYYLYQYLNKYVYMVELEEKRIADTNSRVRQNLIYDYN